MRDLLIHLFYKNSELSKSLKLVYQSEKYRIYSDQIPTEKIYNNFEWLSGYPNYIDGIPNGHYVKINFSPKKIIIDLDALGLRDAFLVKLNNEILISTRIDWLKYFVNLEFDFSKFGSRWILAHQFNLESIFKNVERLISAKCEIDLDTRKIDIARKEIDYSKNIFTEDEYLNALEKLLLNADSKIALSLSGGTDSRVLLSLLLTLGIDFETHTFGTKESPDVQIANQIANDLKLEHYFIEDYFEENDLKERLMNFAATDQIANPISKAIHLDNYKPLSKRDLTIIDGGFAEIWRGEYFKRLYFLPKNDMKEFNPVRISKEVKQFRADIFNDDVNNLMMNGSYKDLQQIKDKYPNYEDIGLQNWLDLLALKTRLPNFFSYEQKRVDQFSKSFMPFIQLSLLYYLFSTPIERRKNAKLFKEIIKRNRKLTKYKLARVNHKTPFWFSSMQTAIYLRIMRRVSKGKDYSISKNLFARKEMILELLNFDDMKIVNFYDRKKIEKLLKRYSKNDSTVYNEIDWLLSFELFRKITSANS